MVSGEVLQSGIIIRECNTEKNLIGISKGKSIRKPIGESGFLERIR